MNWKTYFGMTTKRLQELKSEKEKQAKKLTGLMLRSRKDDDELATLRMHIKAIENELTSRNLTKRMFDE